MSAFEFAAWASGILASLGILAGGWKTIRGLHRLANRIALIEKRSEQLVANSGSSMFDRVNQTHTTVHANSQRLDNVETRLDKTEKKVAKNEGRVEALALVTSPTMLVEDEGKIREHDPNPAQG